VEEIESAGYFRISKPFDGENIIILDTWSFSHCGARFLWAMIVVQPDHVIKDILPVKLSKKIIQGSNYILDDSIGLAQDSDPSLNYNSETNKIINAVINI
jgi:hypothetical protein